jgi:hypothetical protein
MRSDLSPSVANKTAHSLFWWIKLSLPKTSANSLFFIRDRHDILSLSIDTINMQKQEECHNKRNDIENNKDSDAIFFNDWSYSKDVSIVKNTVYCFDTIWEEKENYDK